MYVPTAGSAISISGWLIIGAECGVAGSGIVV